MGLFSVDTQTLINALFSCVLVLSGWILRAVWDAVNSLKQDVKDIEKNLPNIYVRKDDYRDDIKEIKEMLRVIFDKLDSKVDKGS
jgi:hypothetical protein